MRTLEDIKKQLKSFRKIETILNDKIEKTSPTNFNRLKDLDNTNFNILNGLNKELYKIKSLILLLEWIIEDD